MKADITRRSSIARLYSFNSGCVMIFSAKSFRTKPFSFTMGCFIISMVLVWIEPKCLRCTGNSWQKCSLETSDSWVRLYNFSRQIVRLSGAFTYFSLQCFFYYNLQIKKTHNKFSSILLKEAICIVNNRFVNEDSYGQILFI
jgi:hypothetical protein